MSCTETPETREFCASCSWPNRCVSDNVCWQEEREKPYQRRTVEPLPSLANRWGKFDR